MTSHRMPDERDLLEPAPGHRAVAVNLFVYKVDEYCPKCGAVLAGCLRLDKQLVQLSGSNGDRFVQNELEATAAQLVSDHMPSCPQRGTP